jgi:ATP-binding cassette subfamily B protein
MFQYKWTSISLRKLFKINIAYLKDNNFTEIMSNIRMDVANISKIVDQSFLIRAINLLRVLGGFTGLMIISYKLSIIVLLIIPVRYSLVNYLIKVRKNLYQKQLEFYREYSSWYGDRLAGIKDIKLFNIENIIMGQFTKKQRNIIKNDIKLQIIDNISIITESILFEIIVGLIYIIGAKMINAEVFSVGSLLAFITYSMNVLGPISSFLGIKYDLEKIRLSANRLFEFLEMRTIDNYIGEAAYNYIETENHIKFNNISYSYGKDSLVLDGISFEILRGEKVGIVGVNGSGKTTILNILMRLCEPIAGEVFLNNINIAKLSTKQLRELITVVGQDMHLFQDSVHENISLFKKATDEDISNAMKISGAYEFVEKLPNGIYTKIGVSGSKFSAGERQKVGIARALLRKSEVLIFDEATSNFDLRCEFEINDILLKQYQNKTIIFVTHRPFILDKLDKIIVLNEGRLVDIGKHDDLYDRCSIYRELVQTKNKICS